MATRLKGVSQKLIGPHQTSFVPGIQITDNILVFQEVLNSMRTKKGEIGWMIFKIDLEKAYDMISWDFIEDMLEDMGFNQIWRRNIMECVRSPRLAVSWNGQRSEWFRPRRGVRQGGPISPLLFVFCIERLSHIINLSINNGRWKGIKINRQGPTLSHVFCK